MGEPAKLSNETLLSALHAHYGLSVSALDYLPLGADMDSAVYRLEAGDRSYFLKLRASAGFSPKSLLVPRFLKDRGIDHVPAPLPTRTGALWADLDGYALSLHDFIEGETATRAGLSAADWRALGATMRQVHEIRLPTEVREAVPTEQYIPWRRNILNELRPRLAADDFSDPIARELAAFWRSHKDQIDRLVSRCDALAEQMRAAALPSVLCHADLHTWNVLVDAEKRFWIVDWDETVLAPKERDLMFVIGGIGVGLVKPEETAAFLNGYGDSTLNPAALAYYRHAWAVQDLAAYAEGVCLRPEMSEEARRNALEGFRDLFPPGQIVSIAFDENAIL